MTPTPTYRVAKVRVQIVAELRDTCSDLVEVHGLLATVALEDKHWDTVHVLYRLVGLRGIASYSWRCIYVCRATLISRMRKRCCDFATREENSGGPGQARKHVFGEACPRPGEFMIAILNRACHKYHITDACHRYNRQRWPHRSSRTPLSHHRPSWSTVVHSAIYYRFLRYEHHGWEAATWWPSSGPIDGRPRA